MQAMEWMRNMADQLLNHSKTWESSFTTARHAFEEVEQQASEIRGRLLSLTEATHANSFEFAQKVVQARGPQELLQLESEFISRQAQVITEQSKRLSESACAERKKWEGWLPSAWRNPVEGPPTPREVSVKTLWR
jgi:hypothetical protein